MVRNTENNIILSIQDMSNFLSIIWYKVLPAHYGGQKGISRFNHHLGMKVRLTALCSADNITTSELTYKIIPALPVSKTQFFNPRVRRRILRELSNQQYTHVILEHPYHAWLSEYKKKFGFKLIVHAHNIEFLRMKQRNKWWWRWVKYAEQKAYKHADYILFKTKKDLLLAKQLFNITEEQSIIVPYGIDLKEPPAFHSSVKEKIKSKHHLLPGEKIILFAATPDYEPNVIALDIICSKIIPALKKRPEFKFRVLICGKQSEETVNKYQHQKEILFTGFVDRIDEYMLAASVFINPVISGSGIQTKNLEAIANGLSVVTTHFAAEGLPDYLINSKVFISNNNDWDNFAENIISLSGQHNPTPSQFYADFYWGNIIDRTLTILL
ncbi:MAG: glycosyltransferase [Sphingobacteriales bacterium]|nr:MAG: glycosyltransferase [Sphingobacteriales bacterium]